MLLKVQDFIKANDNWKELLAAAPYSLIIKEKGNLVLLKYNQIKSDFSNPIVNECRGLILEKDTWNIVSFPFTKFYNYGESFAAQIDWSTAKVEAKMDGSIISVYFYDGYWNIATSGNIDAVDAETSNREIVPNFRRLFDMAAINCAFDYDRLDPHYTYMFELVSPYNIITCPYDRTELYHIGTRDNRTGKECEIDIGIKKPKVYNITSLQDAIDTAATFDFKKEGFVVKDANYNRVKIKSAAWLRAHHMVNNHSLSLEKILDLIIIGEDSEFLSYYPFYKDAFDKVSAEYNYILSIATLIADTAQYIISSGNAKTKKEFVELVKNMKYPFIAYAVYDGKYSFDTIKSYDAKTFIRRFNIEVDLKDIKKV